VIKTSVFKQRSRLWQYCSQQRCMHSTLPVQHTVGWGWVLPRAGHLHDKVQLHSPTPSSGSRWPGPRSRSNLDGSVGVHGLAAIAPYKQRPLATQLV
jgi:hypothetical protein